jgi:hypothetical protein
MEFSVSQLEAYRHLMNILCACRMGNLNCAWNYEYLRMPKQLFRIKEIRDVCFSVPILKSILSVCN